MRQTVQPRANLGHRRRVVLGELKARHRGGPLSKELHRIDTQRRSDPGAANPFPVRRRRFSAELGEGPCERTEAVEADGRGRILHRLPRRGKQGHRPHSDCFWPDAPEQVLAELTTAGADDSDINKITWQNACNFFSWDPFARTPKEQANVGALRAKGDDVDVLIRPRKEWARLYAEKQPAKA
jgi:hypothetical protein